MMELAWQQIGIVAGVALVAASLGLLIARYLSRTDRKWGTPLFSGAAALVAIAMALPLAWKALDLSLLAPGQHARKTSVADAVSGSVGQLRRHHRVFEVIFSHEPGLEERLTAEMNRSASMEEMLATHRTVMNAVVKQYMDKTMPHASPAAIYAYLRHNLEVLEQLKEKPGICVIYFMGLPTLQPGDIPSDMVAAELDAKADIIESGLRHPAPLTDPVPHEELLERLTSWYREQEADLQEISRLATLQSEPAPEACAIATRFSRFFVDAGEKEGVRMFKSMLAISAAAPAQAPAQ